MKQLKDYLRYHIGAEVRSMGGGTMTYTLAGISRNGAALHYDKHGNETTLFNWKLILYPMDSMTEEQAIELAGLSEYPPHFNDVKVERNKFNDLIVTWQGNNESREFFNATGEVMFCSEQFDWLLKHNFDVFQLINDDLALNKTKQP